VSPLSPPESIVRSLREEIEGALAHLLREPQGPAATVWAAMRHAVLGGGKRLRPLLTLAVCRACGGRIADALFPAAALELIHTYSLVHDDLPAMDDDALRRGRPTVHVAFGEATAILAGDALLTLAFEVLARTRRVPQHPAAPRRWGRGPGGGVRHGGRPAGRPPRRPQHLADPGHKTGALLSAAAEVGASTPERAARHRIRATGGPGPAFQIADDILDATASREALGKTARTRVRQGDLPLLFGLEESCRLAEEQMETAPPRSAAGGRRRGRRAGLADPGAVRRQG
jgi:geranylgeranyl pyrophosphate synthase